MKEFYKNLKTWQKWLLWIVFFIILINLFSQDPTPEEIEAQKQAEKLEKIKKLQQDSVLFEQKKLDIIEWRKKNPKAAKIYDKHPKWTMEECELVSERKIWVGMHYDMLVYQRGKPNSANPSNYGNGTKWQYCWYDYNPGCFYDDNDDNIIDSYN
jgi:hypothetical protein